MKKDTFPQRQNYNALSIWLIGLSGAGKTTLANNVANKFQLNGIPLCILDADEIRKGLNSNLGYSDSDRTENIRRAAEISKLFNENGIITINSYICPTEKMRQLAKSIIGDKNFILVYLDAPIETCELRDIKGLYAKARKGEIKEFTGINAPFEKPLHANIVINTAINDIETCSNKIINFLKPLIF